MCRLLIASLLTIVSSESFAQITAGPMLACSELREVLVWVQASKSENIRMAYWEATMPEQKYFTESVTTTADGGFTATLIANQVKPGKNYEYEIYFGKKVQKLNYPLVFQTKTLWQSKTEPQDFKFAVGSCVYVNDSFFDRLGKPYGENLDIFKKIYEHQPDFMIWGGDNNYLRESDWTSVAGIIHRHSDLKRQPEIRPLLANTFNYAVWDDHDYGNNDSDRNYPLKHESLDLFKTFWPMKGYAFRDEGLTSSFTWVDCQFFMMDDRWFRAPNKLKDPKKDYFGQKQLNWLIESLLSSSATFKIVVCGGQMLNPNAVFENMANYPVERQQLFDELLKHKIEGLMFVSGDRHHTNLQKMERPGAYPLYELTVSPLTSKAYEPIEAEKKNSIIVPGTELNRMQNFGIVDVKGKHDNRQIIFTIYDNNGEKRWDYAINAKDLKF